MPEYSNWRPPWRSSSESPTRRPSLTRQCSDSDRRFTNSFVAGLVQAWPGHPRAMAHALPISVDARLKAGHKRLESVPDCTIRMSLSTSRCDATLSAYAFLKIWIRHRTLGSRVKHPRANVSPTAPVHGYTSAVRENRRASWCVTASIASAGREACSALPPFRARRGERHTIRPWEKLLTFHFCPECGSALFWAGAHTAAHRRRHRCSRRPLFPAAGTIHDKHAWPSPPGDIRAVGAMPPPRSPSGCRFQGR